MMFVLLTYDIELSENGNKRLRRVAKTCEEYGVRVQKSVFELDIDNAKLLMLKNELAEIIDDSKDTIRIYKIGKKADTKVEVLGNKNAVELSADDAIIF